MTLGDAEALDRRFRDLRPFDPRCELTITGGLNRPPMERTEQVERLFQRRKRWRRIAPGTWRSRQQAAAPTEILRLLWEYRLSTDLAQWAKARMLRMRAFWLTGWRIERLCWLG